MGSPIFSLERHTIFFSSFIRIYVVLCGTELNWAEGLSQNKMQIFVAEYNEYLRKYADSFNSYNVEEHGRISKHLAALIWYWFKGLFGIDTSPNDTITILICIVFVRTNISRLSAPAAVPKNLMGHVALETHVSTASDCTFSPKGTEGLRKPILSSSGGYCEASSGMMESVPAIAPILFSLTQIQFALQTFDIYFPPS